MKRAIPVLLLISLYASLTAMDSAPQSPDSGTAPCSHIGNYWGSISAIELWTYEHIRHTGTHAPLHEPYYKHTERIIDDWLFAHPHVLVMTFADAARHYPDVFKKLPHDPVIPELRTRYLQKVLEDLWEHRLTEYRKYEHDIQRESKAHPAGKYR